MSTTAFSIYSSMEIEFDDVIVHPSNDKKKKECYPAKDILIIIKYRNTKYCKVFCIRNNNVLDFYSVFHSRNQTFLICSLG